MFERFKRYLVKSFLFVSTNCLFHFYEQNSGGFQLNYRIRNSKNMIMKDSMYLFPPENIMEKNCISKTIEDII